MNRSRPIAFVGIVALLAACHDSPAAPRQDSQTPSPGASKSAPMVLSSGEIRVILDDAAGRLSGGIRHDGSRGRLRTALSNLDASITAGDSAGAINALTFVREELTRQSKIQGANVESADRDAISLTLDHVQTLIIANAAAGSQQVHP